MLLAATAVAGGPAWTPPTPLSGPVPYGITAPQVAVDPSGGAIAAWSYSTGSDYRVRARFRPPGGKWDAAREWPGWAGSTSVAIDADGDAVVAWSRITSTGAVAEAASRSTSGRWSAPVAISRPEDGWINLDSVDVGMDARGHATATWVSSNLGIRSAYRPAGSAWREPVQVTARYGFEPDLRVSSSGRSLLVWNGFDDQDRYARYAALGQDGTWGTPDLVAGTRTPANQYPGPASSAIDAAGDAVIVWQDSEHGNDIVSAAYHAAGASGWEVTWNVSFVDGKARSPAVGIDGTGNATAVWHASVDVEGATRPAGGSGWERPVVVGARAGRPLLDVSPMGEAVAVWRSDADGTLATSLRSPGSTSWAPGPASQVAVGPIGDLALDGAGNALLVWDGGGGTGAWARALDVSGPVLTRMRLPRRAQARERAAFSVEAVDAWSPLARAPLWYFGDGGHARGRSVKHVYARPGKYQVSVEAVDAAGHRATRTATVSVERARRP